MRLIDADALRAAMYHEAFENDASYDEKNPLAKWDSGLWVRYKMFESCLESAPSIDAVPVRKGYWMDLWRSRLDGTRYWYRACSECDYERDDDDAEKDTNFCPNCGADMRKPKLQHGDGDTLQGGLMRAT